ESEYAAGAINFGTRVRAISVDDVAALQANPFVLDPTPPPETMFAMALVGYAKSVSGSTQVFLALLNSDGSVAWNNQASNLSVDVSFGYPVTIGPAEAGIVTWTRGAAGATTRAQKYDLGGTAQWATGGVDMGSAVSSQRYHDACSDDAGGVFQSWVATVSQ